jgi:raffinose/stachyose/melibiose transport system permease protein
MKQNWLGDPVLARGVVVFVLSWQHIPFHTLMYQGAVRQIPASIYDAAEIEGAGRVRKFLFITLRQVKYTMISSTTLMVVGSLTYFDLIFVLTGGGPGFATRVLPLQMYQSGFQAGDMGTAAVYGVLLAFLGLVIALLLQRLGGRNRQASQLEGM